METTGSGLGGLRTRLLSTHFMHGPAIRFTQEPERLVLHDLPEQAPAPLVRVIELQMADRPFVVPGVGSEGIPDDPYRCANPRP